MSTPPSELCPAKQEAGADLKRLEDLGLGELKRQILAAAGFTPETMGAYLKQATAAMVDALDAEKVQYFSDKGVVTDERREADHPTRLRAAAELSSVVTNIGDLKRDGQSGGHGGVNITLNVPWLDQLQAAKNVTPADEAKG